MAWLGLRRGLVFLVTIQLVLVLAGAAVGTDMPKKQARYVIDNSRIPATAKGVTFHSCQKHLAKILDTYNITVFTDDSTRQPLSTSLSATLADDAASMMSDAEVDAYCQAAHDPVIEQAIAQSMRGPSQRKQHPRAKPSAFNTDFVTDPVSNLFLPHDAEYSLAANSNSFATMLNTLPSGVYTDTTGASRSNLEPASAATITCQAFQLTGFIISTICQLGGSGGVWSGAGAAAYVGIWAAPVAVGCLAAQTINQAAFEGCALVTGYTSFIDGLVDSAEIQGAYENGKKALNNHVVLWNKINGDTAEVKALITQTTNEIKELIGQSTQLIVNTIGELSRKLDDAVETLATQNCDVKNQIADVQREVNYIRFLSVTPADQRPLLGASAAECSVSAPEYCPRASTEKPRRPVAFSQPEACLVSDGARRFELGEEGSL